MKTSEITIGMKVEVTNTKGLKKGGLALGDKGLLKSIPGWMIKTNLVQIVVLRAFL